MIMPITGEKRSKNWTNKIKKMKRKAFLKIFMATLLLVKYFNSTLISVTLNSMTNEWMFC